MTRLTLLLLVFLAAGSALLDAQSTQPTALTDDKQQKTITPSGLEIITIQPGSGARDGDLLLVHYRGRLTDGTQFDSSYEREKPIRVELGKGEVIAGWEEGLRGMMVGEKRQLVIPPDLAYGKEGRGEAIPPDSTLVFEVELVGLHRG